jgi:hypothetical protein
MARTIIRLAAHALALATIALWLLLPKSEYAWIEQFDPRINPSDFAANDGNAALFRSLLVISSLAAEGLALALARTGRERTVSIILLLIIAAAWAARSVA